MESNDCPNYTNLAFHIEKKMGHTVLQVSIIGTIVLGLIGVTSWGAITVRI